MKTYKELMEFAEVRFQEQRMGNLRSKFKGYQEGDRVVVKTNERGRIGESGTVLNVGSDVITVDFKVSDKKEGGQATYKPNELAVARRGKDVDTKVLAASMAMPKKESVEESASVDGRTRLFKETMKRIAVRKAKREQLAKQKNVLEIGTEEIVFDFKSKTPGQKSNEDVEIDERMASVDRIAGAAVGALIGKGAAKAFKGLRNRIDPQKRLAAIKKKQQDKQDNQDARAELKSIRQKNRQDKQNTQNKVRTKSPTHTPKKSHSISRDYNKARQKQNQDDSAKKAREKEKQTAARDRDIEKRRAEMHKNTPDRLKINKKRPMK